MSKRILLVDNDAAVLRMYQDALTQHGFEVDAATNGMGATQALRKAPPNLVVLDLMMPNFTGVDVLKYMRSEVGLKDVPVILLSNSFMNDLANQAALLGVHRAMLKMSCSPHSLVAAIKEVMAGKTSVVDSSGLFASPKTSAHLPEPLAFPLADLGGKIGRRPGGGQFHADALRELQANAVKIRTDLHQLAHSLAHAHSDAERDMRLDNFYRRVRFLSMAAGMAEAHDIGLLASVFEALLFELITRPVLITPSVRRTLAFTTDFLGLLLEGVHDAKAKPPANPQALVVDDDPLSNRLVTAALRRAHLTARSTQNPLVGLQWAQENHFDIVLLDIKMPDMDGFEFCKRLRADAGYRSTPVIFVTSHIDFGHRTQSVLSGGNDLIAKPILPIELAVKAVTHLLKNSIHDRDI